MYRKGVKESRDSNRGNLKKLKESLQVAWDGAEVCEDEDVDIVPDTLPAYPFKRHASCHHKDPDASIRMELARVVAMWGAQCLG